MRSHHPRARQLAALAALAALALPRAGSDRDRRRHVPDHDEREAQRDPDLRQLDHDEPDRVAPGVQSGHGAHLRRHRPEHRVCRDGQQRDLLREHPQDVQGDRWRSSRHALERQVSGLVLQPEHGGSRAERDPQPDRDQHRHGRRLQLGRRRDALHGAVPPHARRRHAPGLLRRAVPLGAEGPALRPRIVSPCRRGRQPEGRPERRLHRRRGRRQYAGPRGRPRGAHRQHQDQRPGDAAHRGGVPVLHLPDAAHRREHSVRQGRHDGG